MNAYELADELDACFTKADWNVLEAANMLRQQADRIAELELQLRVEEYLHKKLATTPQIKEPDCYGDGNVYRGVRSKDSEVKTYVFDEHAGKTVWVSTPQIKELNDEEIKILANKHLCYQIEGSEVSGVFNFAKAILKKASEK